MGYRLRFDGTNDFVQIATACSVNWGTATYTIEFGAIVTRFPASGNEGILGSDAGTTTGITLRQLSGDGALAVVTGGTFRYASAAGLVILNEYHVYRLEHDTGTGAFRWYRDGVQFGSSGTFTTSTTQTVRCFGRANTGGGFAQMDLEYIELTGFTNANEWDANLSLGTGTTLPTADTVNQGTLNNFGGSPWIFYSADVSWSGTIGKTSLTVTTKALLTSLGYQQSIVKSSGTVSPKSLNIAAGHSQTINKNTLTLSPKQLAVQAGTSVSFTGLINKTNFPVTYKTLSSQLGWSGNNGKQTLVLNGQPEQVSAGFEVEASKSTLMIGDKQLSLTAGSSISFVGVLNKTNYPVSNKGMDVHAGHVSEINNQNIPIQTKQLSIESGGGLSLTIGKSSLSLTGKALGLINGQILSAQKRVLTLVGKQLSLGEIEYPIVPVERIFTIKQKDTTYILKQTINLHVMSQPIQTYQLKG